MNPPEILLIESNADLLADLHSLLTREGFAVRTATTLAQAQQAASEPPPCDLLLANLLLRDGSTLDFAQEWTRSGRTVVALTDIYHGPTARQLLIQHCRILDLLEHPVAEKDLVACLKGIFRQAYPSRPESAEVSALETPVELNWFRPPGLQFQTVPLWSTFDQVDVATVLARLAVDRVNGALMLQDGPVKKLVYFHEGTPVGVKSNLIQECLGQMLVREGKINPKDCDRSLDLMRTTNRRQGETLVAMGCLPAGELSGALKRQFLLKYQQVLTWDKGAYRYKEASTPPAYAGVPLDDPANLIWQAVLAVKPYKRVRAAMEPLMQAPVRWSVEGADLSRLTIGEDLLQVWTEIDGTKTANDLVDTTANKNDTLLLLYALTALGALRFGQQSTDS